MKYYKVIAVVTILLLITLCNPIVFGYTPPDSTKIHYMNAVEDNRYILDSDADLLSNRAEWYLKTNPYNSDTDSDGFIDGMEVNPTTKIGSKNSNPLRKNIFVEIDRIKGTSKISQTQVNKLIKMFDESPVKNKTAEDGIRLYVTRDTTDVITLEQITLDKYHFTYYRPKINERRNYGFYHVLVAQQTLYDKDTTVDGVTTDSLDGMLVTSNKNHEEASIIAHELGHQLGLYHSEYKGIDSEQKSWDEYPSVMNYNKKPTCKINLLNTLKHNCYINNDVYSYSDGVGHSDWEFIEENLSKNQASMKFEREDTRHTTTLVDVTHIK